MFEKDPPKDWPRIASTLFYDDAPKAIDWLCEAFGFAIRLKVEGEAGRIEHSELELRDSLIMVSTGGRNDPGADSAKINCVSPRAVGNKNTQAIAVFVDDADLHCAHARAAGATIFREPETDDYGEAYWADRTYGAIDIEGHHWWFIQRVRG